MDGAHTTDPPVPAADGLDNSAEASHEGAAAPPPTATDGGDASAAAGKMEDGKDSEAARAKCLQQVKQILRDADQHWRAGERIKAIGGYDQALALAEADNNTELKGQILLGKGFALMQPAMQQQQEEFVQQEASKRTELAIDADAGLECMKQTLEIAEAAGRTAQANFVKKLIEERGYFALPQSKGCGDHAHDGSSGCAENDTDAIAKAVARGDVDEEGPNDGPSAGSGPNGEKLWTTKDEERLITLVADEGAEEADWDAKAQQLRENRSSCEFTGEDVRNRWTQIAPRVKEELKKQDEQRACGHTCGTCPTRSTCKLHDALDLEVVNDW